MKDNKSLQDELNDILPHFGLEGWKVVLIPDETNEVEGQVIDDSYICKSNFFQSAPLTLATFISKSSTPGFHKINRKVHYIPIKFKLSDIIPLGVSLIKYRQYLHYRRYIEQTELEKVVNGYSLQKGAR